MKGYRPLQRIAQKWESPLITTAVHAKAVRRRMKRQFVVWRYGEAKPSQALHLPGLFWVALYRCGNGFHLGADCKGNPIGVTSTSTVRASVGN